MGKGDDYHYDQSAQEKSYARRFDPQRRALKHKANEAIQAGTKDPQLRAGIAAEIATWARRASPNSYCSNLDGFSYNHPQVREQWHPPDRVRHVHDTSANFFRFIWRSSLSVVLLSVRGQLVA